MSVKTSRPILALLTFEHELNTMEQDQNKADEERGGRQGNYDARRFPSVDSQLVDLSRGQQVRVRVTTRLALYSRAARRCEVMRVAERLGLLIQRLTIDQGSRVSEACFRKPDKVCRLTLVGSIAFNLGFRSTGFSCAGLTGEPNVSGCDVLPLLDVYPERFLPPFDDVTIETGVDFRCNTGEGAVPVPIVE